MWIIPKDQLRDPTEPIPGRGHTPIFGYDVCGEFCYYFTGNTADLNRYLARCARVFVQDGPYQSYSQVGLKLVVHAGAGFASSPAHRAGDTRIDPRAQWMLSKVSEQTLKDDQQTGWHLQITVDIWIDETIKADDLVVPKEFDVALGEELQRLLQK